MTLIVMRRQDLEDLFDRADGRQELWQEGNRRITYLDSRRGLSASRMSAVELLQLTIGLQKNSVAWWRSG